MKQTVEGKMFQMADAPTHTLEERIQRLEDRAAVEECMYHYTNSCDNCDPVGMASCFTDSGILSWGDVYEGQLEGRQAILENLQKMMGSATTGTHLITNMQILFETKDSALVHCYMHSWQCFKLSSFRGLVWCPGGAIHGLRRLFRSVFCSLWSMGHRAVLPLHDRHLSGGRSVSQHCPKQPHL